MKLEIDSLKLAIGVFILDQLKFIFIVYLILHRENSLFDSVRFAIIKDIAPTNYLAVHFSLMNFIAHLLFITVVIFNS